MAQAITYKQKMLVLAGGVYYAGEFDEQVGSNIVLTNAFVLICPAPFYKVVAGKAGGLRGLPVSSIEITDIEGKSKLREEVFFDIYNLPVYHESSYNYTTAEHNSWYKKLHIVKYAEYEIHNINGNAVAITQEHGRAKRGVALSPSLNKHDCYVITFGESFGIGDNLHDAYEDVKRVITSKTTHVQKGYDWAQFVVDRYPDVDALIPNLELLELHNIITNSCSSGIQTFAAQHGIDIDGSSSMRTFITLTKDSFGSDVIKSIADKYGITI